MCSAWDFVIQSSLKALRKVVKEMSAQQNNYRTHRLLSFMLDGASEMRHYFDPISHYLYHESTRRPKPVAHSRLREFRSSRENFMWCKSTGKCRFCTLSVLCVPNPEAGWGCPCWRAVGSSHTPTRGLSQRCSREVVLPHRREQLCP